MSVGTLIWAYKLETVMAVPPERQSSRQHVGTVNPNHQATGAQQTVGATHWPSPRSGKSSHTLPPPSPYPIVLLHAATSACAAMEKSSAELHDGGRSGTTTMDSSTCAVSTPASVPTTSDSSSSSGSGSADPELDLLFELCAHFLGRSRFGGGASRPNYGRDKGQAWVERLLRSEKTFKKRIRMSVASIEHLSGRVRPFLRRAGAGKVGRPPTIPPRVRLPVVLFWLAHGGSQFVACEVADLADSTFCAILREVLAAIIKGLPPIFFPISLASQRESAADFVSRLECRIAGVVGVIYGTLIRVQTPPAAWKAAYNTRKCFYGVLLLGIFDARKRFFFGFGRACRARWGTAER